MKTLWKASDKPVQTDSDVLLLLFALRQIAPAGCWLWPFQRTSDGYGVYWRDGRPVFPHRLSYRAFRGPIPRGKDLRHVCPDGPNPACFNPWHVEPGSHAENMQDQVRGRRAAYQ